MADKRLGHGDKWPETTINGAQYTRPVSTIGLGNGYFAVLDTFGNTPEQIEEVRTLAKPKKKSSKKVSNDGIQTEDS